MDARLVDSRIADILIRINWLNHIRFSCDTDTQIESVIKTGTMLEERGVNKASIIIYMLITSDIENAEYRVQQLKRYNIYAQPEYNALKGIIPNRMQKQFARYCWSKSYKKHTFESFKVRLGL